MFGKPDLLPDRETASEGKFYFYAVTINLFQMLLSIVVAKWRVHSQSKITKPDPRDFKKLNKMSLKEGKITAPA